MSELLIRIQRRLRLLAIGGAALACLAAGPAWPEDKLLHEVVDFTGVILFIESDAPALIIGAVRNGETAVVGFGDADGNGTEPDGNTIMGIGSITKAFTGQVLASLVADGTVNLSDRLQDRITGTSRCPSAMVMTSACSILRPIHPACRVSSRDSRAQRMTRTVP